MTGIETLLRTIDSTQGIIIGSNWNNFTDRIYDQKGNKARPHYKTKATIKHLEWKEDRNNNPTGRELTYLKDGMDRRSMDKGNRLDKSV
jgi:hypothetical protein